MKLRYVAYAASPRIPTTTIEKPSNTLTASNFATWTVTQAATPRRTNLDSALRTNRLGCNWADGWSTPLTISSNQRKLMIATAAVQVNATNGRKPLVKATKIAKRT